MNKSELYKKYSPLIKEDMRIYFKADINNLNHDIRKRFIKRIERSVILPDFWKGFLAKKLRGEI